MLRQALDLIALPSRAWRVLGVNARNRALIKPYNPRRHYPLADDKLRTKEVLETRGIPVPRTLHVFADLVEAASSAERLGDLEDFVIKPANGRAGNGILVLVERRSADTKTLDTAAGCSERERTGNAPHITEARQACAPVWLDTSGCAWGTRAISRWICNIIFGNYAHGLSDRAVIEERLIPMPLLDGAPLFGLPDVRVLVFRGAPVQSMLRLPTRRSHGKANLHQGAIGVGVDLSDGRMTHATYRGRHIESHPDNGVPLIGRGLPCWSDVLDVARAAAAALPLGYLGIDVAIDARRGPMILEVNVRPGLEIQNANGCGLRALLAAHERSGEMGDPGGEGRA